MEPATCGKLEDRRPRYGHLSHPDIKMEKKNNKVESFSRLYFNNAYADVDNRKRARARNTKQRRRISLET